MIGRVVTSNRTFTHLNYALPRETLREFVTEADLVQDPLQPTVQNTIIEEEKTPAFDPGIRLSRMGYQKVLPFVERVLMGSPAHKAGVRKDDLILSINGRNISDASAYQKRLQYALSGEPIELVIQRGREIISVQIETNQP
jgi:S1-C subfamily serine protease